MTAVHEEEPQWWITQLLQEYRLALIAEERAFQEWRRTKPGSQEARIAELAMHGRQRATELVEARVLRAMAEAMQS